MRDIRKSAEYFAEYLAYERDSINEFKEILNEIMPIRGKQDPGVKSGYLSLYSFYFNVLNGMYSAGEPLDDIRRMFPDIIDVMEEIWEVEGGYIQMLWMLSLGIMLDIDDEQFDRLKKLVEEQNVNDYLLGFLIDSKKGIAWDGNTEEFFHVVPYAKLKEVIQNKGNKELSSRVLKEYLERYWYAGHSDTDWYEAHKDENDIYSGYWSFESGAIVKILQLDDSILKGTPYYPYDMVHYQEI